MKNHHTILETLDTIHLILLEELEIPPLHYRILQHLNQHQNTNLTRLSQAMNSSPSWINENIDILEKHQQIQRKQNPEQKDDPLIQLSKEGRQSIIQINQNIQDKLNQITSTIKGYQEKSQLTKTLNHLKQIATQLNREN